MGRHTTGGAEPPFRPGRLDRCVTAVLVGAGAGGALAWAGASVLVAAGVATAVAAAVLVAAWLAYRDPVQ